jgi:hypothetical protein
VTERREQVLVKVKETATMLYQNAIIDRQDLYVDCQELEVKLDKVRA